MAVIQGRTREQLRTSIGYALGTPFTLIGADAAGDNLTFLSDDISGGGANEHRGKWLVFTSGSNDGLVRRVTASSMSNNRATLTFFPSATVVTASGDTAELWDEHHNPTAIHDFINQAITKVTGRFPNPTENVSLHADGATSRFDVPSNISTISKIQHRSQVSSTRIHAATVAFDEHTTIAGTTLDGAISSTSATSVPVASASTLREDQVILVGSEQMSISSISSNTLTVSRGHNSTTAATHSDGATVSVFPIVDTKDKKRGTSANKLIVAAAASATQIVTDSITSKDISRYDTIEMWVKITGISSDTSAGNLKLLLDDTASCASPLEELSIPALSADTWTFVRMTLDNPETDTAIISVGLEYDSDLGACTIWIDDIVAVENDTAIWKEVPRQSWSIDQGASDIVLTVDGRNAAGYALLKLIGADKPALLTTDSATNEIDDIYVIRYATALALSSEAGSDTVDLDARRRRSEYAFALARESESSFPILQGARRVT